MFDHNIFISWSGTRSLYVARALREWLPMVVQSSKPWMSDRDIEKGTRSATEVAAHLEGIKVGIICLTPENVNEPWILFESGALSKTIDDKTRLCPYLIGGFSFSDLKRPLADFQGTKADKEDTRKMIKTINDCLNDQPLTEASFDKVFDALWPEFEKSLLTLPKPERVVDAKRPVDEMVAEILDRVRSDRAIKASESLTTFVDPASGSSSFLRSGVFWPGSVPPPKTFIIKRKGGSETVAVRGTSVRERGGSVVVLDHTGVVAMFNDAESWREVE